MIPIQEILPETAVAPLVVLSSFVEESSELKDAKLEETSESTLWIVKSISTEMSLSNHSSVIRWHHGPEGAESFTVKKTFISTLDVTLVNPDESGFISPGLSVLCDQLKKL